MTLELSDFPSPPWPIAEAHPQRLAVAARLRGLQPAPPSRCRVLEVGCAAGGHLLPLAATFPQSQFVGLDLDARAIANAARSARELGLDNIEFLAIDVEQASAALPEGHFDYALAHGVYSWVSDSARDALLELFGDTLSPQGVAYVSYNAYPGFQARQLLLDMLQHHTAGAPSMRQRIALARELSQALLESPLFESAPALLRQELLALSGANDTRLAHDDLNGARGSWLEEVAERASHHGLLFFGDALSEPDTTRFPGGTANALASLADDALAIHAYSDRLALRRFNRSLFCRRALRPSASLDPAQLQGMHLALPPRSPLPGSPSEAWQLVGREGQVVVIREPALRAGLLRVAERWPETVPVDDLEPARPGGTQHPSFLAALLQLYSAGILWLGTDPAPCVASISARPAASPYAAMSARLDLPIASQYHEQVDLPAPLRQLLSLLDGSRDHAELARNASVDSGAELSRLLDDLARNALLIA